MAFRPAILLHAAILAWRIFPAALLGTTGVSAATLLPPGEVSLESLAAFRPTSANWKVGSALAGNPRRDATLAVQPGGGILVNVPTEQARGHLLSTWEHGDIELELDFLVPPRSNSGVYLQARYEVQIFDSAGVAQPTFADCAGIYQRWDESRPEGQKGFEGAAPRVNVSKAPGLWQHLRIVFRAPRFDAAGRKTENARFLRVEQNGVLVHENVEVTGPTRSAVFADEKPLGPLMLQGDHGSVAFRNIAYRLIQPTVVTATGITFRTYTGEFTAPGDYGSVEPTPAAPIDAVSSRAANSEQPHAMVFEGTLQTPVEGDYGFALEVNGLARLQIDGRPILNVTGRSDSAQTRLAAGNHAFRLDYVRVGRRGPPLLEWQAEGPGYVPQVLTATNSKPSWRKITPILIEPSDGIRLQRGFVPFEPAKRLYAISVGSPLGVHYAYDLELGNVLRLWRGGFLDTTDMWHERGEDQLARPTGTGVTLVAKPALALGKIPALWPASPGAFLRQRGYTLEQDGQPVFIYEFAGIAVQDRIAPTPDRLGLTRDLKFAGQPAEDEFKLLLAEAETITAQDGGFVIGDREYYLDIPAGSALKPTIRTEGSRRQLVANISKTADARFFYVLVW